MPNEDFKPSLTVAVLGHVDSGKSTVVGHLLYLCGCVAERQMTRLATEAANMGKASFKFAWLSDKTRDERERGISIDSSEMQLLTTKYALSLVDAPGHRSFMKNAIAGMASADCAVLVVDAATGAFEAGMSDDGQTKEFALIPFARGMKQLVVAVNKMDAIPTPYAAERFEQIKGEVSEYLAKLGFGEESVQYVPISGWEGENLATKSTRMPWYEGGSLLDSIDNLCIPRRATDKPLRMPIKDAFHIKGVGTVVIGYIDSGVLRPGMQLSFGPNGARGTVFSIEAHHRQLAEASAGMSVGVNVKGITKDDIKRGFVASDVSHDAAQRVTEFTAQITVLKQLGALRLSRGYNPVVHCHSTQVACRIDRFVSTIDRETGEVLASEPEHVGAGEACVAVPIPTSPVILEAFREYPSLGRFVVRDSGVTIAIGVIRSVVKAGGVTP